MMEKNQNLLTIKAFAEAAGRSQQTIYKQIGTRLAEYCREIDGQKYIEHRALKEVFGIDGFQPVQPEDNNQINREDNPENPLYTILRDELAAKNRHIEQLTAQLAEQIQINKELAQSINADRKNELAGTLQQLLPDASPEASCEPVEALQDEEVQEPAQEPPEAQEGAQKAAQKAAEDAAYLRYQQELAEKNKKIQELESRSLWYYLTAPFRKKGKT